MTKRYPRQAVNDLYLVVLNRPVGNQEFVRIGAEDAAAAGLPRQERPGAL